jgi:hypothetical protein
MSAWVRGRGFEQSEGRWDEALRVNTGAPGALAFAAGAIDNVVMRAPS